MKEFFMNIWEGLIYCYTTYSSFIHSMFPSALGDLVEFIIDIAVLCLIVKIVASYAFKTHNE